MKAVRAYEFEMHGNYTTRQNAVDFSSASYSLEAHENLQRIYRENQNMASCNDPAMRASLYSCMALLFDVTVLLGMLTNYIAEAETMTSI